MRFFPQMFPFVWYNFNYSKLRIGVNNNLVKILEQNMKDKHKFKLEIHNNIEVGHIAYPMTNVSSIFNVENNKIYKFHAPCAAEIVRYNNDIVFNPQSIITNKEEDNWLVELIKLDKEDYPSYFNYDFNKLSYFRKMPQEYQCYD